MSPSRCATGSSATNAACSTRFADAGFARYARRAAARQLRARPAPAGTGALEPVETAPLDRWLERIDRPGH
ncbi:hypothetical protein [Cryptosporangium arvum]|uniref:Uncharacterized protein n=1 Tax=Cryptosporangium arvum DSM 44712 TaxID=927661 RepID=A0A010ZVN9_9ACTN|nr:hypothetical protein [Cryptosporangium arvum]EXG81252.1 hypothetical protein CryarDRAFT_2361 [Cryptosporangium arvum DSM 44712]